MQALSQPMASRQLLVDGLTGRRCACYLHVDAADPKCRQCDSICGGGSQTRFCLNPQVEFYSGSAR